MEKTDRIFAAEVIEQRIFLICGRKVILDTDLAALYGVETKRLNEQVKRNTDRFPEDFAFKLTAEEFNILRSQIATSRSRGGRRYSPFAFTEHGAIMAANVLNSLYAVQMSVFIVRAFVKLRETLANHRILSEKLTELERTLTSRLDVHEKAIVQLLDEIKKLTGVVEKPQRKIGFTAKEKSIRYG